MIFTFFRRQARKLLWFIIVFAGSTFILFGFFDPTGSFRRSRTVAVIGSESVSESRFVDMKHRWAIERKIRYSHPRMRFNAGEVDDMTVLGALALLSEAKAAGLAVTPDEVVAELKRLFRTEELTPDIYRKVLEDRKLFITPAQLEETLAEGLLVRKLQGYVLDTPRVSTLAAADRQVLESEAVRIRHLAFNKADFKKAAVVTDKDLETHFKEHAAEFKTAEKVRGEAVWVRPDDIKAAITIPEKDLKDYYDAHKESYKKDEKAGDKTDTPVKKDDAEKKDNTDKKEEPKPEYRPFETVKAEIETKLRDDKALNLAKGTLRKIAADRIETEPVPSLKSLAGQYGAKYRSTNFFAADDTAQEIEGASPEIGRQLVALAKGDLSTIIKAPDRFLLFLAEERKEPVVPKLDEVRDRVRDIVADRMAMELAGNAARTAADEIRKTGFGPYVSRLIEEKKDVPKQGETTPFKRQESIPGLGSLPSVADKAFSLDPGKPSEPLLENNAFYIIEVIDRQTTATSPKPEDAEMAKRRLDYIVRGTWNSGWSGEIQSRIRNFTPPEDSRQQR
ncbi:MAG: peptidylprolyl isomerase [Planctomycetota bacterium]